MSDTGKQSPLGINVLGSLLQNVGFYINPKVRNLVGNSKINSEYQPGELINNTCLKWITYAINDAYNRGAASDNPDPTVSKATYDTLINVGQSRIPALANSHPPTYLAEDPSDQWNGEATSGYGIPGDGSVPAFPGYIPPVPEEYLGQGQSATWYPFTCSDPDPLNNNPNIGASQWGWLRLIALQAWNEFNYNGEFPDQEYPAYRYFLQSFLSAQGFIDYSNKAIFAIEDSKEFLKGVYSNMDDLTSSDITGVSLANRAFGTDLINIGKAMDLSYIATFGLPSNLLKTLKKNNALTNKLSFALLASGFNAADINNITSDVAATFAQEQNLYGAFLAIQGADLKEILVTLNCRTRGIETLADLLSIKKLFPISFQSLTVPIYNTEPNPTNSKTYYLLFVNGQLNPQLIAPSVVEQLEPIIPPIPTFEPEPIPEPEPAITIDDVVDDVIEDIIPPTIPEPPPPETTQDPPTPPAPAIPPDIPLPFVTGRDPAPGRGGGCPAPWMRILLSDGTYIPAGQLQKGMYVRTKHEHTLEEGNYRVSAVTIELQPRVEIIFDHINFVCSTTHKFYHNNDWLEAQDVKHGDIISGKQVKEVKALPVDEVVRVTVEDAHTYICEELFSHNKYTTGGGGGCVALESFVPLVETEQKHNGREITKAWMLETGMKISLGTDNLEIVDGNVVKTLNDYQPCVRIVTSDGITLVCSTTAPILTRDKGFIPATEVYGKRVAVMRNGRTWYDEVVQLEDVGMKFVRVIDAGNNSFWAGERPGSFILHHNVPINDHFNYDKK